MGGTKANGAMKGEWEAKTHCDEKEQRSPQSQEKSRVVDLGTWNQVWMRLLGWVYILLS